MNIKTPLCIVCLVAAGTLAVGISALAADNPPPAPGALNGNQVPPTSGYDSTMYTSNMGDVTDSTISIPISASSSGGGTPPGGGGGCTANCAPPPPVLSATKVCWTAASNSLDCAAPGNNAVAGWGPGTSNGGIFSGNITYNGDTQPFSVTCVGPPGYEVCSNTQTVTVGGSPFQVQINTSWMTGADCAYPLGGPVHCNWSVRGIGPQ